MAEKTMTLGNSSTTVNLDVKGTTSTNKVKIGTTAMPVSGGKITGMTTGTTEIYKDGIAISNPATPNDVGWMRCLGTGESDTVLEIATGDDGGAGEAIVFRGYNTSNAVAYQVNVPKSTGTIALTNQVVTLGDNQTITGAKTFSDINNLSYAASGTSSISPAPTSVGSVPWARDLWHDHFAFLIYHAIESKESSVNGTSWTADTRDLTGLFTERESVATQILKKDEKAFRFVFKNTSFAYSSLKWFEVSVAYTDPFSHFEVLIEHSADKTTWNTCHQSTITASSSPFFLYNNYDITVDGYTRFTFTKKTNETTGSVNLTCIKGLCTRKGNQGLGIELEYPYSWNANMDIYPANNNTSSLGTYNRKWANVYATTFNGNLSGNATTASNASKVNNLTVETAVPKNAVFTDTWRGIQNNLTSDSTTDSLSAAQGKSLANGSARDSTKLPLAGGTMTGNISYNMNNSTQIPLKVYGGDQNGQGISIGAGGATIVGSGESAKACEDLLLATTEELWLTSDNGIRFYTNGQTIANKKGAVLDNNLTFYPAVNNTGSLGRSNYKWNSVYATTFYGNLSGNASTATTAAKGTWNAKTDNRQYQVGFSLDSEFCYDNDNSLQYNPSTNTLKAGSNVVIGSATLAYDSTNKCLNFNFA